MTVDIVVYVALYGTEVVGCFTSERDAENALNGHYVPDEEYDREKAKITESKLRTEWP